MRLSDGVKEIYPSERNDLTIMWADMTRRLTFKAARNEADMDQKKAAFREEAKNRCAALGFVAEVVWEPDCSDEPDDWNLYWTPSLQLVARINKIDEVDHDRLRHEIRSGEADGVAGVVDPNSGLLKEDSKKRDIY